jgi:SAM-dependent methyltransferase
MFAERRSRYREAVSERETFLRGFHATHAGATSRAFARTGSYERLASRVIGRARVLDLACGDHAMPGAIGVDMSMEELAASKESHVSMDELARASASGDYVLLGAIEADGSMAGLASASRGRRTAPRCVQARAQALPFRDASFDACACHLAFMLFDDIERVVAEIARVLVPGGVFAALLGGGPVEGAGERDAFHRFLAVARPHLRTIAMGDPRAKSERGWRELFAGWGEPSFERVELELGESFEDAWAFLGASYQLDSAGADSVRAELHAELGDNVTCRVACWIASVTR